MIPVVIAGSPRRRGERMANPARAVSAWDGGASMVPTPSGRITGLRQRGLGRSIMHAVIRAGPHCRELAQQSRNDVRMCNHR